MAITKAELQRLIERDKQSQKKESCLKPSNLAQWIIAVPEGSSSWGSTFSLVAINYDHRGFWLLCPYALGATISLSDKAVEELAKRYPDNEFLQSLHNKTIFLNKGLGKFFADFGFAWNMIMTIGIYIGGVQYATNNFAKIVAPILAFLPALSTSIVSYQRFKGTLFQPSFKYHLIHALDGAEAPGGLLGNFLQQGLIPINSVIPTVIIGASMLLGLLSSIFREKLPKLSYFLVSTILIEGCISLASSSFSTSNDLYAAKNDDEISDSFFYSNLALSFAFLAMLITVTLQSQHQQFKRPSSTPVLIEEIIAPPSSNSQKINHSKENHITINEESHNGDTDLEGVFLWAEDSPFSLNFPTINLNSPTIRKSPIINMAEEENSELSNNAQSQDTSRIPDKWGEDSPFSLNFPTINLNSPTIRKSPIINMAEEENSELSNNAQSQDTPRIPDEWGDETNPADHNLGKLFTYSL